MSAGRLLALAGIAFVAYGIRAASGIGSALLLVPLGALAVGALNAIVLSAFLDLASGAIILGLDRQRQIHESWRTYALAMGLGVIAGSLALRSIPVDAISKVLGFLTLLAALWFLAGRPGTRLEESGSGASRRLWLSLGVCLVAGLLGGISGMSGPPLAIYFGTRMEKGTFRSVVTRLFTV